MNRQFTKEEIQVVNTLCTEKQMSSLTSSQRDVNKHKSTSGFKQGKTEKTFHRGPGHIPSEQEHKVVTVLDGSLSIPVQILNAFIGYVQLSAWM